MSTETIKIHYCFEDEEVQILEINSNCTVLEFIELARNALGNPDINCAYLNKRLLDEEKLLTQCSKDIKNDVFVVSDDPMKSFKISLKFNQVKYRFNNDPIRTIKVNYYCKVSNFLNLVRKELSNQDIICVFYKGEKLDLGETLINYIDDFDTDILIVSDDPDKIIDEDNKEDLIPDPNLQLESKQVKYRFNNGPIHTIEVNHYCKVVDFLNLVRKELSNQDIICVFYKGEKLDLGETLINHIDDFDTDILIVSDDPDKIIDEDNKEDLIPDPNLQLESKQVKYRFNNGPIHTVKVNHYCKVSDFLNLVRKELLNQDITYVFYKREQLDLGEALINYIDDFDTDILIVSDDPDKIIDDPPHPQKVDPPQQKVDPPPDPSKVDPPPDPSKVDPPPDPSKVDPPPDPSKAVPPPDPSKVDPPPYPSKAVPPPYPSKAVPPPYPSKAVPPPDPSKVDPPPDPSKAVPPPDPSKAVPPPYPSKAVPPPDPSKAVPPPDPSKAVPPPDPSKAVPPPDPSKAVPPPDPSKAVPPPPPPTKTILEFTIFTTATIDSFFTGDVLDIDPTDSYNRICQQIRELISTLEDAEIPKNYELHLYLPCGVPFLPGENPDETSLEEFINISEEMVYCIYVVITKRLGKFINKKVSEPCNCTEEFKMMISPLFESTESGLTQMASLLGYFYHNGVNGEHLLLSLAKISRFPPLIVNLYRFLEHEKLTVRNIIAITGPLFTLFNYFLKNKYKKENVFEYTLRIISFIGQINYDEFLDLQTFDLDEYDESEIDDSDDPNQKLMSYFISTGQQKHMVIWRIDIDPNDFERINVDQPTEDIFYDDQILDAIKIYKPVAPLSLRFIHYPTFIKGNNENEVLLYLNEDSEKDNCINYIDPKVGKIEQISIDELAKKLRNKKKDNFLSLIDGNFVDQIVVICFDESTTMKMDITNHSVRDGKLSRFQIAIELLKSFVAQSCRLRVSSIYGLIGFGNEVIVRQELTALSSQFIDSLKNIHPKGKTLLYDSLNKAQDMILDITVPKNSEGEDVPYPYATSRIIVISDGCDNKSETSPIDLANSLVGNRIIVDTVLISTTDQNKSMCALSQITGGLCFRPKTVKEGIEIFEQEAFLNIKLRRINDPYNKRVTKQIFEEKAESFNKFDEKVQNKALRKANTKVSLATPLYMNYIYKSIRKIRSIRIHRAIKELNTIAFHPSDNYVVYSSYHAPEEWRIFIKGPKGTPFVKKWLNLFMNLPPNYPTQPPSFRFLTVPFHPNISHEGRVVFSLLDKNYNPNLGINSIIEGIVKLLKDPEQKLAINSEASKLFSNYEAYQNKQREEDIGVDDYNEYIEDAKIYEDVPEGADITETGTNSQLIVTNHFDSQRGKVLPKSSNDDKLYD